ncbi:MAG: alpha-2-macroglobulin family protein [Dehalococcoidales bacterium]|nr:alpha-2-macroglobulin family protein [Dehalococcoidales bacterium]
MILVLLSTLAISVLPACRPEEAVENYLAIVPKVLHSGGTEALSLTLLKGDSLISGNVEVTLLKEGKEITRVKETIDGKGTIDLDIPEIEEGKYEIRIKGAGFEDKATVQVERSFLVFLETDKPIYKPGQTVHIRVVALNAELKPLSEPVTVEILDAKGIKIFRSETNTDEYGMASLELPVSEEPNLGTWKITAITPRTKTQLDIRVERYVLPKYEIKVEFTKDWFLVNESITGKVFAEYSFGKPVNGELEIKASRYVGEWQEYATFTKAINETADFSLPAVGYVAGVPAAGGMGNVMLDITVTEKSTGYVEKTSQLLTVAQSPLNIQIIPEGSVFKPGLPFGILLITESPDNKPQEAKVKLQVTYMGQEFKEVGKVEKTVTTTKGKAIVEINPPEEAIAMIIDATADNAQASRVVEASYSPSGNFIHVEPLNEGVIELGQDTRFRVHSTSEAVNFYYEIVSRGKVVFSDFTEGREISFECTPLMAPSSRLLVYQILPNSEVAADYIPFEVTAEYPQSVTAEFSEDEARPGDEIKIDIKTEGKAKVGLAAVDKSVFILAENRLNLQQVFDELERLYMEPLAEIHEVSIYPAVTTKGAKEVFADAGVVVLSSNEVPEGKDYKWEQEFGFWDKIMQFVNGGIGMGREDAGMGGAMPPMAAGGAKSETQSSGLAEVERIRQFFPETWLWEEVTTGNDGRASLQVTVPHSVTTWVLHTVAISPEAGLGMADDELVAFQPFFLTIDLPYSAIRGEEFPVKVAIYNYLGERQSVLVQIEEADWFGLRSQSEQTVEINANDIGGAEFTISPKALGINELKITARSPKAADAVIKTIIIEPEGIAREVVDNLVLTEGNPKTIGTEIPAFAIAGSGRAYLTLTASYLTQTIDGLEQLIQMPFGCGEQNMLLFAPDVYITKYLQQSGQLKPEIMAKAEKLMITGYQRELTYRRGEGSFSAFGESDAEGSLWLTAFVLKSFSQAEGLIYIDEAILSDAVTWITGHQNRDGSFDAVGFVHHQEMIGGVQGKDALTAYTAIALMEAGEKDSSARAIDYLESQLAGMDDPYTVAITAYALELAKSDKANDAYQALMKLAKEDEEGLHWGKGEDVSPQPLKGPRPLPMDYNRSADIENTAYATLALVKHGDSLNASRAAKWLVLRRNAYGGYGSTQDTVVTLQALTELSSGARADVDLTINVKTEGIDREVKITQKNFDILHATEVPINNDITINTSGRGQAIAQVVKRFNLPQAEPGEDILKINVRYDTTEVEVNDLVKVTAEVTFNPPIPMEAGMVVLDVSVPTGFAPVTESIAAVANKDARIKRYEIAGRKVIFYTENMQPGERIAFTFSVKALYPVKAKGVSSQVYSYYKPEIRGETLSRDVTVS